VARGFVDLMGGQLILDDTPGGGLTAIITLPTSVGAEPRPAEAAPSAT
jgi:two-component system sensor histidine kinase KdpD